MTLSPKWTWAPNNFWAIDAQPDTTAITFDVERGWLVLITATAAVTGTPTSYAVIF